MKNLTKILLVAMLIVFASCENEPMTETEGLTYEEIELSLEDEILMSDGEEDDTFSFDENSEKLVNTKFTSKSTDSKDCTPDIEGLALSLPDVVSAKTTSKPGVDAYFTLEILDSDLAGTDIPAWCVDQDLSLGVEGPLDFTVYSSYENLPDGKFERPENFDLVNWILNQSFIGETSPNGGTYNFGHIQYAIWLLVDDSVCQVCTYLTSPIGNWNTNSDNVRLAEEIAQAARDNGEDFVPACGEKIAIILDPEGKQAIIITKEVPALEEECSDCEGSVTELELEFDWYKSKRVRIYQKRENTCYAAKVFDKTLNPGETFTINGANNDGTFGKYIYIYIGSKCYYYTKIKTDCELNIGPGYTKGVFNVISGKSSEGGEICEYIKPDYNKCYRHWECKYHSKCRYK